MEKVSPMGIRTIIIPISNQLCLHRQPQWIGCTDLQILTKKGALHPTSNNRSCNFALSSGSTTSAATSSHVRGGLFDDIFLHEQQNKDRSGQKKNPNIFGLRNKENLAQDIRIGMGMVEKRGLSSSLIKGQWTCDEDR